MVKGRKSATQRAEPMDTSEVTVKKEPGSDEIRMEEERVLNTYDESSDYGAESKMFDLESYCENIEIRMVNESPDGMWLEFDLINIEAPIANALRRVLIAEVPTMAIEKIYLYQNTSVIQDEVLCHRLGLLPLKVDPRNFEWPTTKVVGINEQGVDCETEPEPDPTRNVVFNVNVTCKKNRNAVETATEPHQLYIDSSVYSKQFTWQPCGEQYAEFSADPPRIVSDAILVAKLRPGQQIEASCHCVKGIGRDHAKFSPVATASYRLLPTIRLLKDVKGEAAIRLRDSFSEDVIEIINKGGEDVCIVKDVRRDTCSRNVFRHDDLKDAVQLGRKKNHFIFSVESTGALKSHELVIEACKVMEEKCRTLKDLIAAELESVS